MQMTIAQFCKKHELRPQQINAWIRKNGMPHNLNDSGRRILNEEQALEWIDAWRGSKRSRQPKEGRRSAADDNWDLPPRGTWIIYKTKDMVGSWEAFAVIHEYLHADDDTEKEGPPVLVHIKQLHRPHEDAYVTPDKFRQQLVMEVLRFITPDDVRRRILRAVEYLGSNTLWVDEIADLEAHGLLTELTEKFRERMALRGDFRVGSTIHLGSDND